MGKRKQASVFRYLKDCPLKKEWERGRVKQLTDNK
jgi:hypothetical protein